MKFNISGPNRFIDFYFGTYKIRPLVAVIAAGMYYLNRFACRSDLFSIIKILKLPYVLQKLFPS